MIDELSACTSTQYIHACMTLRSHKLRSTNSYTVYVLALLCPIFCTKQHSEGEYSCGISIPLCANISAEATAIGQKAAKQDAAVRT
jgi:hypothetical protein